MFARRYSIPALSVLSLATTSAGCAMDDPLVGDWSLTSATRGSDVRDYPFVEEGMSYLAENFYIPYVLTEHHVTISTGEMLIDEFGGVFFNFLFETDKVLSNAPTETIHSTRTVELELNSEVRERGAWRLTTAPEDGALSILCTTKRSGRRMSCEGGLDGVPRKYEFDAE